MDCFDVLIDVDDYEVGLHAADDHAQYVALMARRYESVCDKEYPLPEELDDEDYLF